MRMLLLNVKGARSYEELRTINNRTYDTFEEAARARNLLIDDNEWSNVMEEAVNTQNSDHIKRLFAYICVFNRPHDSGKLFDTYIDNMYDDLKHRSADKHLLQNLVINMLNDVFITQYVVRIPSIFLN